MTKIIVLPSSNNSKNRYRASRKAKREYQQSNDSHVRRAVFELHGGHLTTVKALSLPTPRAAKELEVEVEVKRSNHRIWYKDTNPLGSKIHAVQKSRGKSIPLI
ncbi:hypothetical protein U0D24_15575 [Hafnia paralvei]|uniref:hypothetical protein n=1 Tax=Hafnia paralvei TaxID=546367 RepID=UPI002FDBD14A